MFEQISSNSILTLHVFFLSYLRLKLLWWENIQYQHFQNHTTFGCWEIHFPLQWRYNGHDDVSNQHCLDCSLFTQTFVQAQIKENTKAMRHRTLWGEFTGSGEFPSQMDSNAENFSIWWRHHANLVLTMECPLLLSVISFLYPTHIWNMLLF